MRRKLAEGFIGVNKKNTQIRAVKQDIITRVSTHINYSIALKVLVAEVIRDLRPLDKSIESFFKNNPGIHTSEKESLFHLFTFVIRYWITIHGVYKKLFSTHNTDFSEILHIQHILNRRISGRMVCNGKYEKLVSNALNELSGVRCQRESYPEWLDTLLSGEIGEEWNAIAENLNTHAQVILRVNSLKSSAEELYSTLTERGNLVAPLEGYPEALLVSKYFDLFRSEEFKCGKFEQQDAGSQEIAPFLDASPGMRVIDACAGNGGKTLHLSGLMKNKGKIIALDIAPYKLEVLKKRMKRAGSFNIETRAIDSQKIIKRLHNSADRLLLDVPCSGTGVLKRNPDIKYHLSPEKIDNLKQTQEDILDKYSLMLTKGGHLVYSTCSILPSENRGQVIKFLEKQQGRFELLDEKTISPLNGFDGFYMAKLKRCQ
jgi:16S rRNA (cytosine967-C5)-methyltransferase